MHVLTINAGSTSTKVDLIRNGQAVRSFGSLTDAIEQLDARPPVVAHRLVHGGPRTTPTVIDDEVRADLASLIELDPLHEPPALDAMDQARAAFPQAVHVACFDTAFHATIPEPARTYALPQPWRDRLHAAGFHGMSHQWSARRLGVLAPQAHRAVIAHLGGGSSLCGIVDGTSRVTTMGFTPLDGLVMATRAGAIDPGAVLWLVRHADLDVEDLLSRRSGLLGLAGSPDMREVLDRSAAGDRDATFALDLYEHRFVTLLGGCVAAIGGLDAVVFTGGIGENAMALRQRLCHRLSWLGVALDPDRSPVSEGEAELTVPGSPVRVFVVPAREDLVMAADAWELATREGLLG